MHYYYEFDTPVGALLLVADESNLCRLYFPGAFKQEQKFTETPLLLEAERQILAYFGGELRDFSLPYTISEENPTASVLSAIANIPYGEIVSYGALRLPQGFCYPGRFVGRVCHFNHLPIIIPCHRICGKDGTMKGYAGGLALKKHLLDLENPYHGFTVN